jgi:hypothetical protein
VTAIYVANLFLAVALLTVPLWFSRRYLRLPVINPLTITMLVWLPFELMKLLVGPALLIRGGLFDPAFQYAVLMGNVLLVSQTSGMVFFFKLATACRLERYLPFRSTPLTPRQLRRASWVFVGIFALAFCSLASAELGVLEWLENPRVGYQLYRVGQGHWYALSLSALSVAAMLAYFAKPVPISILRKTLLFLALAYLLGSKGVILAHFSATLVVLWFVGWRHVTKVFVLGAPLVFLALLWNLYLTYGDAFELQSIINYFEYYKNGATYYRGILNGDIRLFEGEVFFSSFWAYVPRALVATKPFVYGVTHVNEIFFPGAAELTNTPAFGGAVEQYADFGVIGVIVLGFFGGQAVFNAAVYYLVFRAPRVVPSRLTLGAFLALLAIAGPLFGTFFPGLLYFMLLVAVALVIRFTQLRFVWSVPPLPMASLSGASTR